MISGHFFLTTCPPTTALHGVSHKNKKAPKNLVRHALLLIFLIFAWHDGLERTDTIQFSDKRIHQGNRSLSVWSNFPP